MEPQLYSELCRTSIKDQDELTFWWDNSASPEQQYRSGITTVFLGIPSFTALSTHSSHQHYEIMDRTASIVSVLVAVLGYGLYRLSSIGRRPKGYPPGPPTIPLLGNIHLVSGTSHHDYSATFFSSHVLDADQ